MIARLIDKFGAEHLMGYDAIDVEDGVLVVRRGSEVVAAYADGEWRSCARAVDIERIPIDEAAN